jgi:antirestriction protein ArdC
MNKQRNRTVNTGVKIMTKNHPTMSSEERQNKLVANIINQLEQGTVPWIKPWTTAQNAATGYKYRGMNILFTLHGETPFWLTFNQTKKLVETYTKKHPEDKTRYGIRKGEKGTMIIKWLFLNKEDPNDLKKDGTPKSKTIPVLKHYYIWNISQINLPESVIGKFTVANDKITSAEEVVTRYQNPPQIVTDDKTAAYYSQILDTVNIPSIGYFNNSEGYYNTLYHELAHSTGHPTRLNRPNHEKKADVIYSYEELVAELAACFLCSEVGIEREIDNNSAYIASWLKSLHNDTKKVIQAAGAAQKAVDHILGRENPEVSTTPTK